ncbi:hypothetical protein ECG_05518 [Echinococcus granulosus]|uniref:Uncharacterized protein n=1 Tax=Echinococcus granulosus TaxID=6210 RepID=A0A068WLC5_ECHGR|nr:hypothetical protein ECG_05518 [Echinococcus granulosus]CDS18420.1 hypothetical protein EgrG_000620500 [Echinococcus granulosus]
MESGGGGGGGKWTGTQLVDTKINYLPPPCTQTHSNTLPPLSCLLASFSRPLARSPALSLTRLFVRLLSLWFCKQPQAGVMNACAPLRLFIPFTDATGGGGGGDIVFMHSSPTTIWHQGDGTESGEKGKGRRNRRRTVSRSVKRVDDASPERSSF